MNVTTFINLSGGIDSTYYLWRWLQDNPDEVIVVHHCLYLQKRLKEEKAAVTKILAYLKRQGLTNFIYVETGMQRGTLKGRVLDIEMLSGISSIVVKNHPTVKNILLSYCAEECKELWGHMMDEEIDTFDPSHRYSRINRVLEILTQRNFSYICYRGSDGGLLSKKEMISLMPDELFGMTWFCRRPAAGKPCGKCHTCKKVRKALR